MKAIYFDLDGTIADLYSYENWLGLLRAENTEPYECCGCMVDFVELKKVLNEFIAAGVTIGVISWGAKDGSREYCKRTRKAKKDWCDRYFSDVFTEFHVVKYGTPKHHVRKIKDSILVDDNADVRQAWKGETIDATKDIILALRELLEIYQKELTEKIWSEEKTKIQKAEEEGLFSDLFWENHTWSKGLYFVGQTTFNPITNEKRYWVKIGKTKAAKARINNYLTHAADIYFIDWYSLADNQLQENEYVCHVQLGAKAIGRRTEWFRVTEKVYFEFCKNGFNSFKLLDNRLSFS